MSLIPALLLLLTTGALYSPNELPALNEKQLGQLVRTHRDGVLVVNFWATWCGPCREEFPDLVRVHEERKDAGLILITISMDEPEDKDKAVAFLKEQRAGSQNYIRGFEDFTEFVNAIAPEWSGALPATFIYDREGKRVFTRVGKTTYEELSETVNGLF